MKRDVNLLEQPSSNVQALFKDLTHISKFGLEEIAKLYDSFAVNGRMLILNPDTRNGK